MAAGQVIDLAGADDVKPIFQKMSVYEYDARAEVPRNENEYADEFFHTGLLSWETRWEHKKQSSGVYRIHRVFKCFPPDGINKWSITISHAESIYLADNDLRTPEQVFVDLTLTDENNSFEFDYLLDEAKTGKILSRRSPDVVYDMRLSVTKCSGLLNLIGETTNMMEKFDMSNVVIELSGQQFYFVFEILAFNSQFFYEKWVAAKAEEMPENGYTVTLEESVNLEGFVEILKLLLYRSAKVTCKNVECVLATAKQLKFEMVLIWCEDFLLDNEDREMNPRITDYLAYQYDMSELQHQIALKEVRCPRYPAPKPSSLKYITSKKFDLPEMQKKFDYASVFTIGDDGHNSIDRTINAMFPWKLNLGYTRHPDRVTYSLKPNFYRARRGFGVTDEYLSLNYSIHADINLEFNGNKKVLTAIFTPSKKSISGNLRTRQEIRRLHTVHYKVSINIRSVKGLRYYMNPEFLRNFGKMSPSSTVILCAKDGNVFANLNLLAAHSDYFKATMNHLDQLAIDPDHHLPCVEFQDIEAKILERLVGMVYPNRRGSKWASVYDLEEVLPIADRLLFPSIMQLIEERLICDRFPFGVRTLQVAIDYNMSKLKDDYLQSFLKVAEIHRLGQDPAYKELSEQAELELHRRMMSLPVEEEIPEYRGRFLGRSSRSPIPYSPRSPSYSPVGSDYNIDSPPYSP